MAKYKKTAAVNIPICVACVLLCLTLISVSMVSGLYARYALSSHTADSAEVIGFGSLSLTESGDFADDGSLLIIPGVSLTKKAVVDFSGSESSVYVFVEITPSSDWQTDDNETFFISRDGRFLMQWAVEDNWSFLENDGGSYVYYRALDPNTSLTADIIADGGNIFVSDLITESQIRQMTGISITLRTTAVQNNGFESPAAAWEAIAAR